MMRSLPAAGLVLLLLLVLAGGAQASDLRVANGRVLLGIGREDPVAYFVARSASDETLTIVGARSPRAADVTIRRTAVVDGQWGSEPMPEGMPIPPRADVAFTPRGLFLQLGGAEELEVGEVVSIVLVLDNGNEVAFDATVEDD